jgi:hypothetical protein
MASNDTFNEYFTIALGCRKLEVNTICINTHISGPPGVLISSYSLMTRLHDTASFPEVKIRYIPHITPAEP